MRDSRVTANRANSQQLYPKNTMKSLVLGAFVLGAATTAQAQASSLELPKPSSQTPALDAFAGLNTQLQLQVRWVQINSADLPSNLPAWDKLGTSSHVATTDELKTLELLKHTGLASVEKQQVRALNNQSATLSFALPVGDLSFAPSVGIRLVEPLAPVAGPPDAMIIPRGNANFAAPYIPNLARPQSRMPAMAPMPGIKGKLDPPVIVRIPAPDSNLRPQMSPQSGERLDYQFQIRPMIVGNQIALDLRSVNAAQNFTSLTKANYGETIVFSFPNMVEYLGSNEVMGNIIRLQTRRTFLLVTPQLALNSRKPTR